MMVNDNEAHRKLRQEERRVALALHHELEENLWKQHEHVVLQFSDPLKFEEIKRSALGQIQKWEDGNLCHVAYINKWRAMLALPADLAVKAILARTSDGAALRQNTPFNAYL